MRLGGGVRRREEGRGRERNGRERGSLNGSVLRYKRINHRLHLSLPRSQVFQSSSSSSSSSSNSSSSSSSSSRNGVVCW